MNGKLVIYILDTTALLYYARYPGRNITVEKAFMEVKRDDEKIFVSGLVEGGLIDIEEPPEEYTKMVIQVATRTGDIRILSRTDIEISALALYYRERGEKVIVITDDYAIQNILESLDIEYQPLSRKIKKHIKWVYACSKCGRRFPTTYDEDICMYCGGDLVRMEEREG